MNRDTFAADRSGRLERFDRYLQPYVERALAHYGEAGWYEPIVREATALWEGMYRGEESPADKAEFRETLQNSLKLTGTPTESSVDRVTKWVGTYTANHAEHSTAKNTGKLTKEWVTRHDDKVRALHREVDGQTVPSGEKFDVGGYKLRFPGDPVGPPEVWINCVIGSTEIGGAGQSLQAATRRTHEGTFVHLRTVNGHDLTVTPNHPVLTTTGYIPAGRLRPGDQVLASKDPAAPQVADGPASAEQRFRALCETGEQQRVVAGRVDFHGDRAEAEVDVVWADRYLPLEVWGEPGEPDFVVAHEVLTTFATVGDFPIPVAPLGRIARAVAATTRLVRSEGVGSSLSGAEPFHPQPVRLGGGPTSQVEFVQASTNDISADTDFARHLEHALSLGMAPTEIALIEVQSGHQPVYNFQTSENYYTGNGIALHNCRCLVLALEGSMTAAASEVTEVPFRGIAAATDVPTGDGRQLARDGFSHRDLPMPLNYQRGSSHGGDPGPAYTIGRIDQMALNEDGLVEFSGIISTAFPESAEAIQHLESRTMNGVSVDVDAAKEAYQSLPSPEDFASEAEFVEAMQSIVQVFSSWRISGVTMCAIPAFPEAFIGLADAPTPELALAASGATWSFNLVASISEPLPAAWFQDPGLSAPTPFTVMDDGRVFGHVATWGVCHIGHTNRCTTAPHSATGYAYYRTGVVRTTAGDIPVGQITMGAGHADLRAGAQAAAAHYDNTAFAVADVAAGEDTHGIWLAGALRNGVSDAQVHALRAAALSGDWRDIRGNLELVAALAVNTPGFPIPRVGLAASGANQTSLVAAGIVAGPETITMADAAPSPTTQVAHPGDDTTPDGIDPAVAQTIAAIDAHIDAALMAVDPASAGYADLQNADQAIDALMVQLGIPDADHDADAQSDAAPAVAASAELRAAVVAELARQKRIEAFSAKRAAIRTMRLKRVRALKIKE